MSAKMLWQPSESFQKNSNLFAYMEWLKEKQSIHFDNYSDLWKWSLDESAAFWKSLWNYFSIIHEGNYSAVISDDPMPLAKWFDGTKLSYAEHVFRNYTDAHPAIIFKSESGPAKEISWKELRDQTASIQDLLNEHGVGNGETVAAFLPCIPEATISMLATTSLGAIWSSCSPDFGTNAVIDRFAQIAPRALIAVDSYTYNGKKFSKQQVITDVLKAIPSIELLILIKADESSDETYNVKSLQSWKIAASKTSTLSFSRVPFAHPLWILYSSGTTGLPKAITHSCGGILIETLKYCTFHNDFKPGERCFWYTTTGWMMWNYIHGSLLCGSTMVIYDGGPAFPDLNVLWRFIEDAGINHFGTSAGFILANMKENINPSRVADLSSLRSIGSTGSTLPAEGFTWAYKNIKSDLWLASMSGGTDVCSAFVGGNPLWPVYEGEIQCRALGCGLFAFDEDGRPLIDEEGEMVITRPMPSMPVFFWNDPDFSRYRESYFEMFPGIWRHGDWIRITPRDGVIIYGRSDATLNRGGVRIGTSEIYRAVDQVPEVKDSLIICIDKKDGEFYMPLFVVLKEGFTLTSELVKKINSTIRNAYSPRHVPDEVIETPEVPYTISGKKTEMPVKKILMGKNPETVINAGSLKNPGALQFFKNLSEKKSWGG